MFSGGKPDCVKCGFVQVIPENFEVIHIIEKYVNFMIDGMSGSPDLFKILKILELEDLEDDRIILEKILFYIQELNSIKHEKSSNVSIGMGKK